MKEILGSPALSGEDKFLAYITAERYSGECSLLLLREKNFLRKEYELHSFHLCFNHEGIKGYEVRNVVGLRAQYWQEKLQEHIQVTFGEAVSLLQDAYNQNCKFGTKPAGNPINYREFLIYDTAALDRDHLLRKLSFSKLTPAEFTNVYLNAVKRLDHALLFDLSGAPRKRILGTRQEFLRAETGEPSHFSFLKNQFVLAEQKGRQIISRAYVIVCTLEEKMLRIDYQLVLEEGKHGLELHDFRELERRVFSTEHPENPLNYHAYCSDYAISGSALLRNWLLCMPDVFLTGEFVSGECYKLLKTDNSPLNGFDVTAGIICEFILKEQELIIYAPSAVNLARMERLLAHELKNKAEFRQKYYLPVRELYKTVILGHTLEGVLHPNTGEAIEQCFATLSAFSCSKKKGHMVDLLQAEATCRVKLDHDTWYFIKEKRNEKTKKVESFMEYYVVGNWIRINAFGGDLEKELARFGSEADIILGKELKKCNNSFPTRLSPERIWQIYKMLKEMAREAPSLKEMGIIPSIKATALVMSNANIS